MSANVEYQFVDTNVLVYAHDRSADLRHEQAVSLLQALWETERGCLSIQVLQEFFVTITRKVAKPLSTAQASQIVASLGTWRVHSPGVNDVQEAIAIQDRYGISFWDAMIIRSAVCLGCSTVWSEDLNTSQRYESAIVANPFS